MEIQTNLNYERNFLTDSFRELYPNKPLPKITVTYSKKFSDYNGNVKFERFNGTIITLKFYLSSKFVDCEEEIKKGIVQELMNKVYKTKIPSLNQELYHNFVKHVSDFVVKRESDDLLKELFAELNVEYFDGIMEEPTMRFGNSSSRTLGNYNYVKDLITISSIFLDKENNCLDRNLVKYVLYHELLHKKLKFKRVNYQNRHHTKTFRDEEKAYVDQDVEAKLKDFLFRRKLKKEILSFSFIKDKLKKFF